MSNFFNQKTYAQATKNQPVSKGLSLFEETLQPVRVHSLPYDNERETQGDGNCFYNAIIDQIPCTDVTLAPLRGKAMFILGS